MEDEEQGDELATKAEYLEALEKYDDARGHLLYIYSDDPDVPQVARIYEKMAKMQIIQADYSCAMESYQEACRIRLCNPVEGGDVMVACNYLGMASVGRKMCKYREVSTYFQKALEIYKTANRASKDNLLAITTLQNEIAQHFFDIGKFKQAMEMINDCIRSYLMCYDDDTEHDDLTKPYTLLGKIYAACGQYEEAFAKYRLANVIFNNALDRQTDHAFKMAGAKTNLAIANTRIEVGEFDEARKTLKQAELTYDMEFKKDAINIHTALLRQSLGHLHWATGDLASSLNEYNYAYDILSELFECDSNQPLLANALDLMGDSYLELDCFIVALENYKEASKIRTKVYFSMTPRHAETADGYARQGIVYCRQALFDKSLEFHQRALKLREKIFCEENKHHPDIAQSHSLIADVYSALGQYKQANDHYNSSIAIQRKIFDIDDTVTNHTEIINSYCKLAFNCAMSCNFAQADEYHSDAVEMCKDLAKNLTLYPQYALVYVSIAEACLVQRRYFKSFEYAEKVYKMRNDLGERHPKVRKALLLMAEVKVKLGQYEKARAYLDGVLLIYKGMYGIKVNHSNIARCLEVMSEAYQGGAMYSDAHDCLNRAITMYQKIHNLDDRAMCHPDLARCYRMLGLLYQAEGRCYRTAEEYLNRSLTIYIKLFRESGNHLDIAQNYYLLGKLQLQTNRPESALECLVTSLAMNEKLVHISHISTADIHSAIGEKYYQCRKYSEAVTKFDYALGLRTTVNRDRAYNMDIVVELYNLGDANKQMNKNAKAYSWYRKTLIMLNGMAEFDLTNKRLEADTNFNLGFLANRLDHDEDFAAYYYKQSLELYDKLSCVDKQLYLLFENFGTLEYTRHNYKLALELYKKALHHRMACGDTENSPDIAKVEKYIGDTCYALGKYNNAYECHIKALSIIQTYTDDFNVTMDRANIHLSLALDLQKLDEHDEALEYFLKAECDNVAASQNTEKSNNPDYFTIQYSRAVTYSIQGDFERASYYINITKASVLKHYGLKCLIDAKKGWQYISRCMRYEGENLLRFKKYEEALQRFKDANTVIAANISQQTPDTALNLYLSGRCDMQLQRFSSALGKFHEALNVWSEFYSKHPDMAMCYRDIGRTHESLMEYDEALAKYETSYSMNSEFYETDHKNFIIYHEDRARIFKTTERMEESREELFRTLELQKNFYGEDAVNCDIICTLESLQEVYHLLNDEANTKNFSDKAKAMKAAIVHNNNNH